MSREIEYNNLIAFHPGSYVEDIIDDLNITQKEFAKRLGVSPKTISKLVNAEIKISDDIASKLSKLTGISISTWFNLQKKYDLKVLEIEEQKKIDKEIEICEIIDFGYFKKHGFVEEKRYTKQEKVQELRKILKISSLEYLKNFNHQVSYRNTKGFLMKSIVNSNVMLEIATNYAKDKTDIKLNVKKLEKILPELRAMTKWESDKFYPEIQNKLLSCGVVLLGLPALKNSSLSGATKIFKNGSVLLLITDKNKSSDIFWFYLFHELGHILNSDFYSDYKDESSYEMAEKKADDFAKNTLIPLEDYTKFCERSDYSEKSIINFANEMGIHPSIVLGRLQKDGKVEYNEFNNLKKMYNIVIKQID